MSSDKENIPPTESVTPPSLRNLSLEEEANKPKNEATSWEASVVRNVETIPRASSPYPRKTEYFRGFRTRHGQRHYRHYRLF